MTGVTQLKDKDGRLALDWQMPSTRQNSLITDLCLQYLDQLGDWLPAAGYVRLLGDLGVPENSARTGLHRMTKGGFLRRETRDGASGYAPTTDWRRYMSKRYPELLDDHDEPFTGWTLLSFSIPESRRSDRHVLRSSLARQGFGTVANGLWIRPDSVRAPVAELIEQLGFTEDVRLFTTAQYQGSVSLREFASQCWDLDTLDRQYRDFIAERGPRSPGGPSAAPDPRQAFTDLTATHNQWRLIVQADPRLPAEALPSDWTGHEARALVENLLNTHREPALDHVRSALEATKTRSRRRQSEQ
ncbi:PaaX family transcriptional regulator C-terminal domain-containing protein [Streptomyces sp. NPDC051018]|uniref:PaaX family transcriptional regulator n=1 Tax=Streptomyces sp. NPDC051018 TaxID=3365639 RepID=UPI0037A25381